MVCTDTIQYFYLNRVMKEYPGKSPTSPFDRYPKKKTPGIFFHQIGNDSFPDEDHFGYPLHIPVLSWLPFLLAGIAVIPRHYLLRDD